MMNTTRKDIEINIIIDKLANLFDYANDYVRFHEKALTTLLSQREYRVLVDKHLLLSEIHVIDCIGKNKMPNTTFIAKNMNMTKGAISKITSKLLDKKLIKSNHLEENKKEIYFTLTAQGKVVFDAHEKVHHMANEKIKAIFANYSREELRTINVFLEDLLSKLSSIDEP
jgi:DNA-binding MarR family transcriptional regulator